MVPPSRIERETSRATIWAGLNNFNDVTTQSAKSNGRHLHGMFSWRSRWRMTPPASNDNARLYRVQRLDIDTGRLLPGPEVLVPLPPGAIPGPISWPFQNHREA
jgi:hypothetical protein